VERSIHAKVPVQLLKCFVDLLLAAIPYKQAFSVDTVSIVIRSDMCLVESIRVVVPFHCGLQLADNETLGADGGSMADLKESIAQKELLIQRLHEEAEASSRARFEEATSQAANVDEAREELAQAVHRCSQLEAELAQRPTQSQVDDMKQRMEVLRAVADFDITEEDELMVCEGDTNKASASSPQVQAALKAHNRHLASEVTTAKRMLAESSQELEIMRERCENVTAAMDAQKHLIAQLENDLRQRSSQAVLDSPHETNTEERGIDSLLSDDATLEVHDPSMLEIVVAQRERFRQRNAELEEQLTAVNDKMAKNNTEHEDTKKDNLALYEKIRFLQGYYSKQAAQQDGRPISVDRDGVPLPSEVNKGARYSCGPFALQVDDSAQGTSDSQAARSRRRNRYSCFAGNVGGSVDAPAIGGEGDAEARYRRAYEDRLNPFNEFAHREEEQQIGKLRLHDRIALSSGRFFLGNKYARTFVFVYTIFLHLFIVNILYSTSRTSAAIPCTMEIAQG